MFVGRSEEINLINKIANKSGSSLLLYGKRKVGKTTLLNKALELSPNKTIYFECIKSNLKDNINSFVNRLYQLKILNFKLNFDTFEDVFIFLNSLDCKFNVIIDEYPYLKKCENPDKVDSIFQNIIDNNLKNISLFISGSHVGMMKDLLEEKNALYGRFNAIIKLKELNYIEISSFYNNKSNYEKIAFYSVFGGSPFVNGCLDPNKSLKYNIVKTILNPNSAIYNYAENLLISDLSNNLNFERILYAISNGKKKHKDIEDKLGMEKNGLLSKQLNTMVEMDLVSKVYPINMMENAKRVFYEINDNLLRFYYTYIYSNKSSLQILGPNNFYDEYIEPSLNTFISHRFEEMCRSYFSLLVKANKINGVLNIGTYYYDDPINKVNGEFDIALKMNNGYQLYEAKYYKNPLTEKEILEEESQVYKIKGLNISKIGFISTAGFEKKFDRFNFIDINEIYSLN